MEGMEKIVRLAKPQKKGLLRLIFSRFFLIVLLLALQVLVMVAAYGWLREKLPILVSLQGLFSLGMVLYLFNCEMDSTAKLTWMFLIAVMPLPGAILLAFTQANLGHRELRREVEEQITETMDILPQKEEVLCKLEGDSSGTAELSAYLRHSGCFPVCDGTQTRYFPGGEEMLEALLPELEKAERFIFLEFFIIEEGTMWGRILEVLTRKAREGVDVRVMYDGMCESFHLPAGYWKLLEKQGIRAKAFAPIIPLLSSHYNYRDHRKILVIDGRIAYTGGVNLADEYINRVRRFGRWKDAAIELRGGAVKSFTLLFLQMWNIGAEAPEYAPFLEDAPAPDKPQGYVLPYGDCPLDREKVGESVYMDILNRAKDYVHIMTPYLILDGELEAALRFAALRGVQVQLILPGIPDKQMAYALAKTHYRALLEAGVELYEYSPGFVHAKVFVSDDIKAVVGSINLDYRSLYHHFECAAYLYRTACIPEIEADFQRTLKQCRRVTPESVRQEKRFYKLLGSLMKFLAPLM